MNAFGRFRRGTVANVDEQKSRMPPVVTGNYVTKDQRVAVAQEVKKSHFILGSDESMGTILYFLQLITEKEMMLIIYKPTGKYKPLN